ncbi:hypothetical protein KQX54_015852 [Cotesia glomerata]|uniref:Uncharacterized protein n=1 Tax=Cotesia glomerata TaxID=32391 RepID=A0AAV7J6Z5_COTGL|nr:hypothetical protein KQX54_015852 [Cotesia glomerata]
MDKFLVTMANAEDANRIDRFINYELVVPRIWLQLFNFDMNALTDHLRELLQEALSNDQEITGYPHIRIGNFVAMLRLRHDTESWWFQLFRVPGAHSMTSSMYKSFDDYAWRLFLNISNIQFPLIIDPQEQQQQQQQQPLPFQPQSPSSVENLINAIQSIRIDHAVGLTNLVLGRLMTNLHQQEEEQRQLEQQHQQLQQRRFLRGLRHQQRRQRQRQPSFSDDDDHEVPTIRVRRPRRRRRESDELDSQQPPHVRRRLEFSSPPPPPPPLQSSSNLASPQPEVITLSLK